MVTTAANYLFPVGTSSFYTPATFNFNPLGAAIDITAEFIESPPGLVGLPYNDGSTLNNTFQEGYWHFSSSAAPANTYTLTLTGNGFTSYVIDANTRITGRNAASPNWQAFGTHGSVTNQQLQERNYQTLIQHHLITLSQHPALQLQMREQMWQFVKEHLQHLMVQGEGHISGALHMD